MVPVFLLLWGSVVLGHDNLELEGGLLLLYDVHKKVRVILVVQSIVGVLVDLTRVEVILSCSLIVSAPIVESLLVSIVVSVVATLLSTIISRVPAVVASLSLSVSPMLMSIPLVLRWVISRLLRWLLI